MEDDKTGHADPRSQSVLGHSRWFSLLGLRESCGPGRQPRVSMPTCQSVPVSPMQMDNVKREREAMESFALATATNPTEVFKAIAEPKLGKSPGPNGAPNRA